jgi:hypothetical protein
MRSQHLALRGDVFVHERDVCRKGANCTYSACGDQPSADLKEQGTGSVA